MEDNYERDETIYNPCRECVHKWGGEKCMSCKHYRKYKPKNFLEGMKWKTR